jgi:hypothetical protein
VGLGRVAMGELVEYLASFRKVKRFSGQTNRLGTKGQGAKRVGPLQGLELGACKMQKHA